MPSKRFLIIRCGLPLDFLSLMFNHLEILLKLMRHVSSLDFENMVDVRVARSRSVSSEAVSGGDVMRKRVLFIANSLDNAHKFKQVLQEFNVETNAGPTTQLKRLFAPGIDYDLVVFEARATAFEHLEEIGLIVEQRGCPLLLIVDESNVGAVKFPVGIACDFVMHGAGQVECAARVRRLLGDSGMDSHMDVAVIDDMVINFATYQVVVDGSPVDLTYLEYALLAFLVQHTDRTFSRDMLLQNIWGFDYRGGSRTVDVHIRRIRAKLGPKLAQYMKTVRGVGYHWSSS